MRHWQASMAMVPAVAVVALLGGCANPASQPQGDGETPRVEPTTGAVDKTPVAQPRRGELPGVGAASCVENYNAKGVASRAFAFDGTVTDIAAGQGDLGYVAVTFAVNEWFHGGNTTTVTVGMASPDTAAQTTSVSNTAYEVGSRLLVSGEPRWGGGALADAVAWGCGFTRYYDESTAASWRHAGN